MTFYLRLFLVLSLTLSCGFRLDQSARAAEVLFQPAAVQDRQGTISREWQTPEKSLVRSKRLKGNPLSLDHSVVADRLDDAEHAPVDSSSKAGPLELPAERRELPVELRKVPSYVSYPPSDGEPTDVQEEGTAEFEVEGLRLLEFNSDLLLEGAAIDFPSVRVINDKVKVLLGYYEDRDESKLTLYGFYNIAGGRGAARCALLFLLEKAVREDARITRDLIMDVSSPTPDDGNKARLLDIYEAIGFERMPAEPGRPFVLRATVRRVMEVLASQCVDSNHARSHRLFPGYRSGSGSVHPLVLGLVPGLRLGAPRLIRERATG